MISETHLIDCMEFMRTLPDKFFDLCVTDPPYGVNLEYGVYHDTIENWYDLMDRFIPEIKRVCQMAIFPSCSINKMGWLYKNHPPDWLICWYKGSPGHSAYVGFNDWEPLLVYGKIKGVSMHDYMFVQNGEKMGSHGHPCPKPVQFFKTIYKRVNVPIQRVVDPFMGSQSSRIAAYQLGFDYWGCELDPDYYRDGCKRFDAVIHKKDTTEYVPVEQTGVGQARLF